MPSKRLTDWDKSTICRRTDVVLERLHWVDEVPIKANQVIELLIEATPTNVLTAMRMLKDASEGNVLKTTYRHTILAEDQTFTLHSPTSMPMVQRRVLHGDHPMCAVLAAYTRARRDNVTLAKTTSQFIRSVVVNCTSAAQVNRVLPFLVDKMGPGVADTLAGVERRSRWPSKLASYEELKSHIEEAHNALTIASLLPEEPSDVEAWGCITVVGRE